MPKVKPESVLPCGCVRKGHRCAVAQQLWQVMQDTYNAGRWQDEGFENFRKAVKAYEKHREGE